MSAFTPCTLTPADRIQRQDRLTRLEDELTTLTGHINAATARFLLVLAEFDRLEGWRPHGLTSTAHWLHWRCGFGLNAAREKVRVARALVDLPQIRACFETGALSYSKVRAMTRIATPANEDVLLLVARHGTTRHVETLVSKWRGAERSREVQRAGRQHAVRSLRWHYDDDGCLVIRATLPPEQGALVIEALQAALERLEEEGGEASGDDRAGSAQDHATCRAAEASAPVVDDASSLEALDEAADETADETAEGAEQETARQTADVVAHDRQDVSGVTWGGLSSRPIEQPVPHRHPYEHGHLHGQGHAHSPPDHNLGPDLGPTLSQRRADALAFLAESWLAGDPAGRGTSDAYLVNVHIDSETLAHSVAGRSELAEGPGLAAATVRRLCCDGGLVTHLTDAAGATLDVGRKTRAIPPAIRRAMKHRDRCCRFPGCTRSRWLDGHHVVHWADGGETSLDNLVRLCRHHHRLVHEGGFGAHVDAGGQVRFTTPAGAVIAEAPDGRELERPLDESLETLHLKRGVAIDARTADCHWRGERMDYDSAGWLLMQAALGEESGNSQPAG